MILLLLPLRTFLAAFMVAGRNWYLPWMLIVEKNFIWDAITKPLYAWINSPSILLLDVLIMCANFWKPSEGAWGWDQGNQTIGSFHMWVGREIGGGPMVAVAFSTYLRLTAKCSELCAGFENFWSSFFVLRRESIKREAPFRGTEGSSRRTAQTGSTKLVLAVIYLISLVSWRLARGWSFPCQWRGWLWNLLILVGGGCIPCWWSASNWCTPLPTWCHTIPCFCGYLLPPLDRQVSLEIILPPPLLFMVPNPLNPLNLIPLWNPLLSPLGM